MRTRTKAPDGLIATRAVRASDLAGRQALRPFELPALIGCSRAYAYELVRTGKIRSVRAGAGAIFVPMDAVQEFLSPVTTV